MTGQISLIDYIHERDNITFGGCGKCVCRSCLYWWSGRCPYGGCWDNHRAETDPYDKAHPDEPPRTAWSYWDKPGEQAHWCRGGTFYPAHYCPSFTKYNEEQHVAKDCLMAIVEVYQDGYIRCGLVDLFGCESCYREFEDRLEE